MHIPSGVKCVFSVLLLTQNCVRIKLLFINAKKYFQSVLLLIGISYCSPLDTDSSFFRSSLSEYSSVHQRSIRDAGKSLFELFCHSLIPSGIQRAYKNGNIHCATCKKKNYFFLLFEAWKREVFLFTRFCGKEKKNPSSDGFQSWMNTNLESNLCLQWLSGCLSCSLMEFKF